MKKSDEPKNIPGVPKQVTGGFHDSESVRKIKYDEDIDLQFHHLKERFFAINYWKNFCPESSADFKLCDLRGNTVERLPQTGDYIRIDIPGPGGTVGRSFDWAVIDWLDLESPDRLLMQCRPAPDPKTPDSKKIAHFYSAESTSTFIIAKGSDYSLAGVYGRNEKSNYKSGILNSARNFLIAIGGILGFSKIQWECLVNGMTDFDE
ncbi:hypothetical protein ASG31_05225 [Chryseobacterium sp. Leaf404]|uniref:hypothetical protein n=1 Tax=unclassified Chryseobacterium TaxID=2593645 RepID=UPI0006F8E776|nr:MULTISPECIES: hypothetical protein [unclassified Chryseobacterium]KQT18136.1 hypothetical protein ASG31_05225 [Chryseobacterium sp. Leaf404]